MLCGLKTLTDPSRTLCGGHISSLDKHYIVWSFARVQKQPENIFRVRYCINYNFSIGHIVSLCDHRWNQTKTPFMLHGCECPVLCCFCATWKTWKWVFQWTSHSPTKPVQDKVFLQRIDYTEPSTNIHWAHNRRAMGNGALAGSLNQEILWDVYNRVSGERRWDGEGGWTYGRWRW